MHICSFASMSFFAKRTIFSYVPKKTHSSALGSELELAFSHGPGLLRPGAAPRGPAILSACRCAARLFRLVGAPLPAQGTEYFQLLCARLQ